MEKTAKQYPKMRIKNFKNKEVRYEEKVIKVRRVTKVVKGGKILTYRALVVVGDTKRKVGVGIGRADDSTSAIEKAILDGIKNFIIVPLTRKNSIPHVAKASYGASSVMLRPASEGTGVIAGASVRSVLELAGIKNILGKQFGSNNLINSAKATILALISINETIELGKSHSMQKQSFYEKIMKKYKHEKLSK